MPGLHSKLAASLLCGFASALRKDVQLSGKSDAVSMLQEHISTMMLSGAGAHSSANMLAAMQGVQQSMRGPEFSAVHDSLRKVIEQIEAEFEPSVKAGHAAAQNAINGVLTTLDATTQASHESKTAANTLDTQWVGSVDSEKKLLAHYEKEKGEAVQNELASKQLCAEEEEERDFEFITTPNPMFSCDASKGCAAVFEAYKKNIDGGVASIVEAAGSHQSTWDGLRSKCTDASKVTSDQQQVAADALQEFRQQKARRTHLATSRKIAMCAFGEELHEKCISLDGYEVMKSRIVEKNGDSLSTPDRESEWKLMQTAKCMISDIVNEKELTAATLAVCEQAVDYERDVGVVNMKQKEVASWTDHNKFNCQEETMAFNSTSWVIPDQANPSSADYSWVPRYLHLIDTTPGSKVFDFCNAVQQRGTCGDFLCPGGGAAPDSSVTCKLESGCTHIECCGTEVPGQGQFPAPPMACGGMLGGKFRVPCSFPFQWEGKVYHSCTTDAHPFGSDGRPWCSVTPGGDFMGFCDCD